MNANSSEYKSKLIRVFLGLLLLSATVRKANALGNEQVSLFSWLSNPRWQVAIIEVEAVLGLWLLSGRHRRGAWLAALTAFSLLGAASLYMALTGQRSCGSCFGQIEVNPWLTFALDAVAVAALAFTLPPRGAGSDETVRQRGKWVTGAGTALLLALLASPLLLASGDLMDALAWIRGEPVTLEPSLSDVGEGAPGTERVFRVHLTNHTRHPIGIVGGTVRCDCITTDDLPLTLQAGETQEIKVRMRFAGSPGRFQHRFLVFVDDGGKERVVNARYEGRVNSAAD